MDKRKRKTLGAALRMMVPAGIEFMAVGAVGMYDLRPEQVIPWIEDPASMLAEWHGWSREIAVKFIQFCEGGCRCTGTTRKGQPCQMTNLGPYLPFSERVFRPGHSDRCRFHQELD